MTSEAIGSHGISLEEILSDKAMILDAFEDVISGENHPKLGHYYEWMRLPFVSEPQIDGIIEYCSAISKNAEAVVVFGMGGSALGTQAIAHSLKHMHHNSLPKSKRKLPKIYIEDNIDPEKAAALLDILDLKKTYFNFITKSGETPETLSQFLIVYDLLKKRLGDESRKRVIVTTTIGNGSLYNIAQKEGFKIFSIPKGVGGRFSVFSNVGLVPLVLLGIDVKTLLKGAREMDEMCRRKDAFKNPALMTAYLQYKSVSQGKNISVMMPYAESLRFMADFYAQLWGESLGKKYNMAGAEVNAGQTPVKALGATDQHSQIQLYTEGPYDKVVAFIGVEKFRQTVLVPCGEFKELEYLSGKNLCDILNAERRAAAFALKKAGRSNFSIILPEINEQTVGGLLTYFMYKTCFMGAFLGINPFDQPGVEEGKRSAYAMIGRQGYEGLLDEIVSAENKDFIIE